MADLVNSLATWLVNNSISVLIGSVTSFVIISIISLISLWRLRGTVRRYHLLTAAIGDEKLEKLLIEQVEAVRIAKEEVDGFQGRLRNLERAQEYHLQRIGVVRFNAFDETGSDQSFSVALLDHHNNGVVISCIHGRDEARTYAKPIARGESSYRLSHEELLAIEKATNAEEAYDRAGKSVPSRE